MILRSAKRCLSRSGCLQGFELQLDRIAIPFSARPGQSAPLHTPAALADRQLLHCGDPLAQTACPMAPRSRSPRHVAMLARWARVATVADKRRVVQANPCRAQPMPWCSSPSSRSQNATLGVCCLHRYPWRRACSKSRSSMLGSTARPRARPTRCEATRDRCTSRIRAATISCWRSLLDTDVRQSMERSLRVGTVSSGHVRDEALEDAVLLPSPHCPATPAKRSAPPERLALTDAEHM